MGKDKKDSLLKKLVSNIFIRNILIMVILFMVVIWGTLFYLKIHTHHNDTIEVPSLLGLQTQDAEAIIKSSGLKYEVIDSIYHQDGTPGAILEQIPKEKSRVKSGRTIYLTIQAKNEASISIPDLEDSSLRQAQAILSGLGFSNVRIEHVPSEYQDLVFGVEYKGLPVKSGQKIPKNAVLTLRVGNGLGSEPEVDEPDDLSVDETN